MKTIAVCYGDDTCILSDGASVMAWRHDGNYFQSFIVMNSLCSASTAPLGSAVSAPQVTNFQMSVDSDELVSIMPMRENVWLLVFGHGPFLLAATEFKSRSCAHRVAK